MTSTRRPNQRIWRPDRPYNHRLSSLFIAIGLALTLVVALSSPILAHEDDHSAEDQPASSRHTTTRLAFMQQDLSTSASHLVGGAFPSAEIYRGLAIGGTANHQRSQVVRSAPSGPDITTTSDAWQHIPELFASIDTPANARLAIVISAEAHTSSGGRMFVRALIDGKTANPSDVVFATGAFNGTKSFDFVASNLSGETHTVSLQWRVDAGHTGYLGDRSLIVSASPDSPERGALSVIAAPSGPDVTTTDHIWQPVPHLATTIATADDADLAITVSAEANTSNGGRMFVRALVDDQPVSPSDVVFAFGSFHGAHAFTFIAEDLAAGDHNVQIQWIVDDGSTGFLGDRTLVVTATPPSKLRNALIAIAAPSGPLVTKTEASWQPIPDLATSIETPANTDLAISMTAEAFTSSDGRMFVRALVDGGPTGPADVILARGDYSGTRAVTFIIEDLPAGNHVIQLQWWIDPEQIGYLGDRSVVVAAGQRERQHLWTTIGDLHTNVTPAVEGLENDTSGAIYVVTVTTAGQIQFTTTDTPTVFTSWQTVGSELTAAVDTDPVLIRNADHLHLFVRGADDNLYESRTAIGQPWTDWTQLTTDGSIQGSISTALSLSAAGDLETHVLYQGTNDQLHYRRFVNALQVGSERVWSDVLQGRLGSDAEDIIVAVILMTDRRSEVFSLERPWTGDWQHQLTITPSGSEGGIYDLSNIVFFADAFHVGLAVNELADDISMSYRNVVRHLRLPIGDFQNNTAHTIAAYTSIGDRHALTQLVLYRNKLMAAFTAPDGQIHQTRWDTADPAMVWVGENLVDASRTTTRRPNLGVFNMRAFHPAGDPEYGISSYGNDAFAVMTDSVSGSVNLINFSRAMFIRDIDAQLTLYHANAGTSGQGDPDSPTPTRDPSQDGRPFVSELGYALWTIPYWLADGTYSAAAQLGCLDGTNTSGRFDKPCDNLKYPVIIRKGGGIWIGSGIWQTQYDDYIRIWEELGHTTSGTMGLADDGQAGSPTQTNADLVHDISLDALTEAYNLFGERTGSRPKSAGQAPNGRFRGFTGIANNYDAGSRQHSFIYIIYYYVSDGERLRGWAEEDLEAGDDLLERKYDWVRTNIYKGVEFQLANEPLTD